MKNRLWTIGVTTVIIVIGVFGLYFQGVAQDESPPAPDKPAAPTDAPPAKPPAPTDAPATPTPTAPADAALPLKIGVVNIKTVFDKYNKTADYDKLIEREKKSMQAKLDELIKEVETLKEEIEVLDQNSELRAEKELRYKNKVNEYQIRVEAGNKALQKKHGENTVKIYIDIKAAIDTYAKENNYTLIFKADPLLTDDSKVADADVQVNIRAVLYWHPSLDITSAVIKVLNKE